jgi:hypothetical protein
VSPSQFGILLGLFWPGSRNWRRPSSSNQYDKGSPLLNDILQIFAWQNGDPQASNRLGRGRKDPTGWASEGEANFWLSNILQVFGLRNSGPREFGKPGSRGRGDPAGSEGKTGQGSAPDQGQRPNVNTGRSSRLEISLSYMFAIFLAIMWSFRDL